MPYLDSAIPSLPFQAGSDTSKTAAVRARQFVGQQGAVVLTFVTARRDYGATQKEIAFMLQLGRPSVCARVRALEQCGEVVKTSDRRDGCAVYRVREGQ